MYLCLCDYIVCPLRLSNLPLIRAHSDTPGYSLHLEILTLQKLFPLKVKFRFQGLEPDIFGVDEGLIQPITLRVVIRRKSANAGKGLSIASASREH